MQVTKEVSTLTSFVVNRAKWRCGREHGVFGTWHGTGPTKLLNADGYKCCLGFVCEQLGFHSIKGANYPYNAVHNICRLLAEEPITLIPYLTQLNGEGEVCNTVLATQAAIINDDTNVGGGEMLRTRSEKEEALIALFAKYGLTLIFEGNYENKATN